MSNNYPLFHITSGLFAVSINAENLSDAFALALMMYRPESIGEFYGGLKDGDDEDKIMWGSTEKILEKLNVEENELAIKYGLINMAEHISLTKQSIVAIITGRKQAVSIKYLTELFASIADNEEENKKNVKFVQVNIYRLWVAGKLKRIKLPDVKYLHYGLPEYFDANGNLRPEFYPTEVIRYSARYEPDV